MAGGAGERFWPLSRQARPKQLLKLTHPDLTLLEEAVQRIAPLIPAERIYIATARGLVEPGGNLPEWLEPPLRDALADSCLRLPAGAMRLLDRIADPRLTSRFAELIAGLPTFLADPAIRADIWPPAP